jgi:hypothetical protein
MNYPVSVFVEDDFADEQTEPDLIVDGLDRDGFPGGDRRFNSWPTTLDSAIEAVLEHVHPINRHKFVEAFQELFPLWVPFK